MGDDPKQPTMAKLFGMRMEREGRSKEYNARIKEVMADGKPFFQARILVMKEFGYAGPEAERSFAEEHKREQRKAVEMEILGEVREEARVKTFEDAIVMITGTASPAAEIEWVRSHPAMSRWDRQRDKTKPVEITADDILYAPHGQAPSRSAVNQLIHWANRPGEFYKQILSEHRKRVEEGGELHGSVADPGVGDIQAYLAQIKESANRGEKE